MRMAVMATEQPQTVPSEHKLSVAATDDDKMALDRSTPPAVNGHSTTDIAESIVESAGPQTNGDKSPSIDKEAITRNSTAFEANSALSPPATTDEEKKSKSDDSTHEDSVMADADGDASSKDKTEDVKPTEAAEEAKQTTNGTTKPEAKPESDADAAAGDSMDIDPSVERPDVTSSVEHGESTQDTTTAGDETTAVSTPQEMDPVKSDEKPNTPNAVKGDGKIDVSMKDTSISPSTKVAREREDDSAEEPAAKRARTEEPSEMTADSLTVATGTPGASKERAEPVDDGSTDAREITLFQNKQVRAVIAGIKKTKNGGNFRKSVQDLWPGLWNDYIQKVDNPVDLSLFEHRLRENKYNNYGEFKNDVRLLYQNCVLFNGEAHIVTEAAASVRDQIFSKLPEISLMSEPTRPEKGKSAASRHSEVRATTQPRRQSQPQSRITTSPKPKVDTTSQATPSSATSATAPAFAVPPNGVPQIRRDSTRDDGDRPKRPIHPPKNRDLDYGSKGARKKKLDPEQKFMAEVLSEIKKGKHFALNQWFMEPVDPVAFNIPTYFSIVKKPMDLRTMTERNDEGQYKSSKDLEKDMKQIITNSELFNGPDHDVTKVAKQLEALLKSEIAKKDTWMSKNYPPEPASSHGGSRSPDRSADESEEESEAEAEEEDNETIRNLQSRLKEEQDKLNTLIGSKRPDLSMIEIQQSMVSMIQRKLVEEKTRFLSEKKPKKKKSGASSKSKSKSGGGGGGGSLGKKGSSLGASASKKSGGVKKAALKKRTIGALEKAVIAEGINELDGNTLTRAVEIIKRDTGQNENDDGEMELDIDALSNDALWRLYELIHRAHPNIRAELSKKPEFAKQESVEPEARSKTGTSKNKKNKPMNKHEQERKIEQLRELKAQLARHGSGSQEPFPVEGDERLDAESSDESDSEEE